MPLSVNINQQRASVRGYQCNLYNDSTEDLEAQTKEAMNYTYKQVGQSLAKHGFQETSRDADEMDNKIYIYEREYVCPNTVRYATLTEDIETGICLVDGINPKEWSTLLE